MTKEKGRAEQSPETRVVVLSGKDQREGRVSPSAMSLKYQNISGAFSFSYSHWHEI